MWLPHTHRHLLAASLIGVLAIASRSGCWGAQFVYDDNPAVLSNPVVMLKEPLGLKALSTDYWGMPIGEYNSHGSYRPVTTLSFRLSTWLGGSLNEPAPAWSYRVVSLILHAAVCMLAYAAYSILTGSFTASVIAAACLAVCPLLTEATCSIACRADVTSGFLALLTVVDVHRFLQGGDRRELAAAIVLSMLSTLSKETGIVSLLVSSTFVALRMILALGESGSSRDSSQAMLQRGRLVTVACDAAVVTLLAFRFYIMGFKTPTFSVQDSVLVGMPRFSLGWVLTAAYLFSRHLGLLVWPHPLGVDWSYLSVAPVLTIWDARNLWSLAVLGSFAGLTLFAIRRSMAVPQVASGVKRAIVAGIDKVPTPLKLYVPSALIAFVASAVDGSTPSSLSTNGIASPGPSISAPPQSAFKSTRKRASSTASTSKKASRAAAAMLAEEISSNGASSSTPAWLEDPARLTTPSAGAASDRASAISSAADAAALPLPLPVVLLFSLLSILICMLPASSLLFDVGFTIAERVMYTPSIAAGLTLATLIAMFEPQINSILFGSTSNKSNRTAFAVVLASLFGGLMYRSYIEALHWNDESSNWGALLAVNPRNAKAWYEIGHQAQLKGDYHSTLLHYRTSIDTYNSVVAEIESTANAGGLFSSPYPGISDSGSWARLYPDPYVNSVMIYLNLLNDTSMPLVERQRKALGMLQEMLSLTRYVPADKSSLGSKGSIAAPAADQLSNTSALLSHLHSQCISAPWGSEDGAAAGKWDSQTSCVLSGGSGLSVDPRFTRVMDRTVTTALSHLNRAIVGGLVEGGGHFAITQDAAEQILLATTLLSRISPAIAPESAPLVMGDELTKRSAYNLAIVWYEKMLRWQLQRVSAAGDDDAAAAPASASNSESGSTAAGLVASYEDLAAAVRSQMQWKFVPSPKPSRIEISEEVLAAADASPFAGMALQSRDAHALYQNLKIRVLPPAHPASPSLTATSAASSSSGSASHLDGMYCLDIPHAPGTRHGGPPSMTAARSLIPSGAATSAQSASAAFDCATPTDIATPCGRALIAASKSAEAAASAFREARDRSVFASFRPCTCESSTMEVRGVQQPQQSLRVCAAPSVALPVVADPPHSHYISHFGAAQSNSNATCAPARCAKRYPDVATGTAAAAFAAADRLVLSDFVSLDLDTVTLPQALYLARRAEVLTQAWINSSSNATAPRNSNPSAASGSTLSNSVKQALYAGSGPLSALLHICGCASAPGVKL